MLYKSFHNQQYSKLLDQKIDIEIFDLVENINKKGCKTYWSCQGGMDEEEEENPAFIIIDRENSSKVINLFPTTRSIEIGCGSYMISDFSNEKLKDEDLLYITFN